MNEKNPVRTTKPLAKFSPLGEAVIKVAVHLKQVVGLELPAEDSRRLDVFMKAAEPLAVHRIELENPIEARQIRQTLNTLRSLEIAPNGSATQTVSAALDEFEVALSDAGVKVDFASPTFNRYAPTLPDGSPDFFA